MSSRGAYADRSQTAVGLCPTPALGLGGLGLLALTAQAAFTAWGPSADKLFGVYGYGALLGLSGALC